VADQRLPITALVEHMLTIVPPPAPAISATA